MGASLILQDHLHGKETFHVDHFSSYNLAKLYAHSGDSDNEDKNTNVIFKVDQGSMANGDDKTNRVFQANTEDHYNLSHLATLLTQVTPTMNKKRRKRHPRSINAMSPIMLTKQNHVFLANPGGRYNLTLLGQLTDSSSSDESN